MFYSARSGWYSKPDRSSRSRFIGNRPTRGNRRLEMDFDYRRSTGKLFHKDDLILWIPADSNRRLLAAC